MTAPIAPPDAPTRTRAIFVVGMHRSGTSCLTGCLEDLGLYIGSVNRAAPHNAKGNNEIVRVRIIHDQALERAGASWFQPTTDVTFTLEEEAELRDTIASLSSHRHWGVKDPRMTFLLDRWREFGVEPALVGSFRAPLEVVASLEARNGFMTRHSMEAWKAYNIRLLELWRSKPFPLIRFDQGAASYDREVRRAAELLGLDPAGEIKFRDEELRHNVADDIPGEVRGIWNELLDASAKSLA